MQSSNSSRSNSSCIALQEERGVYTGMLQSQMLQSQSTFPTRSFLNILLIEKGAESLSLTFLPMYL